MPLPDRAFKFMSLWGHSYSNHQTQQIIIFSLATNNTISVFQQIKNFNYTNLKEWLKILKREVSGRNCKQEKKCLFSFFPTVLYHFCSRLSILPPQHLCIFSSSELLVPQIPLFLFSVFIYRITGLSLWSCPPAHLSLSILLTLTDTFEILCFPH